MVGELLIHDARVTAAVVAGVCLLAEAWHARRVHKVARLAFGPRGKAAFWARGAPLYRILACSALAWGLTTLATLTPTIHGAGSEAGSKPKEMRHLLMVLDVSPSMNLRDAGPDKKLSRRQRVHALMTSFFSRVPLDQYKLSIVAAYSDAKPVVVDTRDMEVVANILGDLPMEYAFKVGKTRLLKGIECAFETARSWNPGSTTVVLLSDGDTVPPTGMPKKPASVSDVLVVGVGDPIAGKFINGRQSRQDVSTLRQIAIRLGGVFHEGNSKHLSSTVISSLHGAEGRSLWKSLGLREYALVACALGGAILGLLPLLLHHFGTGWRPGVVERPARPNATDFGRIGSKGAVVS